MEQVYRNNKHDEFYPSYFTIEDISVKFEDKILGEVYAVFFLGILVFSKFYNEVFDLLQKFW